MATITLPFHSLYNYTAGNASQQMTGNLAWNLDTSRVSNISVTAASTAPLVSASNDFSGGGNTVTNIGYTKNSGQLQITFTATLDQSQDDWQNVDAVIANLKVTFDYAFQNDTITVAPAVTVYTAAMPSPAPLAIDGTARLKVYGHNSSLKSAIPYPSTSTYTPSVSGVHQGAGQTTGFDLQIDVTGGGTPGVTKWGTAVVSVELNQSQDR
jgi:hypothetical protein